MMTYFVRFLILLICLVSSSSSSVSATDDLVLQAEVEHDILKALFEYTDGPGWTKNDGWNDPQVHYCNWHGISCVSVVSSDARQRQLADTVEDALTIDKIDLSENNLRGSVPISLLVLLPNLRTLQLNGNNVDYGQVAQQEQEVLGTVLNLNKPVHSNIEHIDLSRTAVRDISRIFTTGSGTTRVLTPHLKILYASQAQLRGSLPNYLFEEMPALERVMLDHNSLTGSIPITVGNWRSVKYLSFVDNLLTGTIPETVNQLGKLRYLLMESNRFTGTIPIGLQSDEYTPLLEQIDLSDQRDESTPPGPAAGLSGPVPAFGSQKRLRRVDLGVNSFSGTIPSTLLQETDFGEFDYIILSSNSLTGSIPQSVLARVPSDDLFLDDNLITSLSQCPVSEYGCSAILCPPGTYEPRTGRQQEDSRPCLSCPQNQIYWGQKVCKFGQPLSPPPTPIPTRAPFLPPTPFAAPPPTPKPMVEEGFPVVDNKAVLLELFDATGGSGWSNSDGWATPDVGSYCNWHGVVCESPTQEDVKFLHLDGNNMIGTLPQSIYTLPYLRSLDVSHNNGLVVKFDSIGTSISLEALDLSSTQVPSLDGIESIADRLQELHISDVGGFSKKQIPSELLLLTDLRQLTLDYNDAAGSLPADLGRLSKLVIFSAAYNELEGPLPSSISTMTDLATLRLTTNHMSGTLPTELQSMSSLSLLDLSNQWSNGLDDDFGDVGRAGFSGPLPSFSAYSQLRRLDLGVNSFSGTIPEDFLVGVDAENLFEFADIGDNFLTGTVPAGIASLHDIYMSDNLLVGIDPLVCSSLPAALVSFGCDAIMCPPGTYNERGRQESNDKPCQVCAKEGAATYWGSTDCVTIATGPTEPPMAVPTLPDTPARQTLQQLYKDCGGSEWSASTNWMDETVSICEWAGVRCSDDGDIVQMSFRSNNLVGTFPSRMVFENIPTLERLVLDGNVVLFSFEGIENAVSLDTLDLTHTELNSVKGVENAPAIADLYLASNNLDGSIPSEILQMTTLVRLALAFNDLTGTIPDSISVLSNLQFLSIHDNVLTGSIPASIGQLSDLVFLLAQANSLTGSIPTEINFLQNLGFFSLSHQRGNDGVGLTGRIPSMATLTNLKKLDFSSNSLTGAIPADFLDRTPSASFEHMDLSKNKLSGSVPAVLVKFPAPMYDFSDNELTGIDQSLCDRELGGAVEAYGCDAVLCAPGSFNSKGRQLMDENTCQPCEDNKFFGSTVCHDKFSNPPTLAPIQPLPELTDTEILTNLFDSTRGSVWRRKDHWKQRSMSVCQWFGVKCSKDGSNKVEHISLSANNLLGTVPSEVFQLPHLKSLIIDSNKVHVDLSGIGNARKLTSLDISGTDVTDISGIGNAKALTELHIKQNSLQGTFPNELFEITTLEQLDFDYNSYSGPLQHGIGKLTNLKLLTGEKNKLSGVLPEQLKELTDLVTLRLGKNSFRGNLPDAIDQMTSLAYIDLSHQKEHSGPGLSGPLPAFENLRQLRQIRLKSNALSGTVPFNFLKNVDDQVFEYADLSSNAFVGNLPSSLAHLKDIYLHDNLITGVPEEFCAGSRGATYLEYGCDAFMCRPGTVNSHGRQESDSIACKPCPQAKFFGTTKCTDGGSSSSDTDEREILIKLFQTCGGNEWDDTQNWLESNESICNWAGIKCMDGSVETVEAIELGANNVVGTPPPELFSLPNLKSIALYSNPLQMFRFEGIENAARLTEILLDATGITSLDGLEKAPRLEVLNLRFNSIQGTFPTQISQLSTLHTLTMAYNDITGELPSFLENLSNLKTLLLSNNGIGGSLHSTNLPQSIRRLDLSDNELTGEIPNSFLALVPFEAELEVDLSGNRFAGSIPTDLVRFTSLNLFLKDNMISELDPQLCRKKEWNDGDVGKYGCDGLLCPSGHFAQKGRHSSAGECRQCHVSHHVYMGSSSCEPKSSSVLPPWGLGLLVSAAATLAVSFLG